MEEIKNTALETVGGYLKVWIWDGRGLRMREADLSDYAWVVRKQQKMSMRPV